MQTFNGVPLNTLLQCTNLSPLQETFTDLVLLKDLTPKQNDDKLYLARYTKSFSKSFLKPIITTVPDWVYKERDCLYLDISDIHGYTDNIKIDLKLNPRAPPHLRDAYFSFSQKNMMILCDDRETILKRWKYMMVEANDDGQINAKWDHVVFNTTDKVLKTLLENNMGFLPIFDEKIAKIQFCNHKIYDAYENHCSEANVTYTQFNILKVYKNMAMMIYNF